MKSSIRPPRGIAALLALSLATPVSGLLAQAAPEIGFDSLAASTYLVRAVNTDGTQLGANMVVMRSESGTVLVDTNFPHPQLARLIRGSVEAKVGPLTAVVITHWHPDHSGGIEAYRELPVHGREEVVRRLSEETQGIDLGRLGNNFTSPARPAEGVPNRTVADGDVMPEGPVLHHVPAAHTDGDTFVEYPTDNVFAMGDLYWPGLFPVVDAHNGGTPQGLAAAIRHALEVSDANSIFVPGHGEPTGRADLQRFAEMIEGSIANISERAAHGDDLADIVASRPLAEWDDWGHALVPVDQWVRVVHASLD